MAYWRPLYRPEYIIEDSKKFVKILNKYHAILVAYFRVIDDFNSHFGPPTGNWTNGKMQSMVIIGWLTVLVEETFRRNGFRVLARM